MYNIKQKSKEMEQKSPKRFQSHITGKLLKRKQKADSMKQCCRMYFFVSKIYALIPSPKKVVGARRHSDCKKKSLLKINQIKAKWAERYGLSV